MSWWQAAWTRVQESQIPAAGVKSDSVFFVVGSLVALVGLSHWLTPASSHNLHAAHVLLRKFFIRPIVLAAIWFEFRGAVRASILVTVVYLPHVLLQWENSLGENINQAGELGALWLIALLAGSLVGREKRALREAARTHEGSLIALVAALDAREHNTQQHSLRVRAYSLRIGEELGLPHSRLRLLAQAALLHDVGKIGTPDHILLKPGHLTARERQIMQTHPEIGRRILSAVPFLRKVAEVVFSHREKFDGTGYQRRLSGQDIPLEARVFAVADVLDAVCSDRPYHAGINLEQAHDLIAKESGRHFDPTVVDAFFRISCSEWNTLRISSNPPAMNPVRID